MFIAVACWHDIVFGGVHIEVFSRRCERVVWVRVRNDSHKGCVRFLCPCPQEICSDTGDVICRVQNFRRRCLPDHVRWRVVSLPGRTTLNGGRFNTLLQQPLIIMAATLVGVCHDKVDLAKAVIVVWHLNVFFCVSF